MIADKLDTIVLNAIKSYPTERPAMLRDLWSMVLVRRACSYGITLNDSLKRLKKSGNIRYSRKPAGWIAT